MECKHTCFKPPPPSTPALQAASADVQDQLTHSEPHSVFTVRPDCSCNDSTKAAAEHGDVAATWAVDSDPHMWLHGSTSTIQHSVLNISYGLASRQTWRAVTPDIWQLRNLQLGTCGNPVAGKWLSCVGGPVAATL